VLPSKVTFYLGKIRRSGYVLLAWESDHEPRHVHVYRNGRLVVKWDLENRRPMVGEAPRKLVRLIERLRSEGLL
jgi:Domain of unknown function (DUF4160)